MADTGSGPRANDPTQIQAPTVHDLNGLTLGGRYKLDHMIGAGGMAQVWHATDLVLGREVAVKVLHSHLAGDPNFVSRFRAEAIAAARLSHQNIVGVFDTCSDGQHEAIVMELLEASTLRNYLDEHRIVDADTTVRIALRLLDALEAAHRAGLVHRDVKPSNILLCDDGRVKIADFGIAKTQDQTELTQEGSLVGTAAYLAPEQLLGEPVDGRTDLYSLGVVLYECLTGRVPFRGDTGAAVALARLHSDPLDPRQVRADVPPALAAAVMRALERKPEDRFRSAADLRAALLDTGSPTAVAPIPSPILPPESTVREPSFTRSERRWIYPALFILLVGTALTVSALMLRQSATNLRPRAASTSTSIPSSSGPVAISKAVPFDPQGDGQENNRYSSRAIDGDTTTAWRTETYNPPGFTGSKTGVGLALELPGRTRVDSVVIDGSHNRWSASLFVIDAPSPDGTNPSDLSPLATITGFETAQTLDLTSQPEPERTGSTVLVWITDLGQELPEGKFRVEISNVSVDGAPVPG